MKNGPRLPYWVGFFYGPALLVGWAAFLVLFTDFVRKHGLIPMTVFTVAVPAALLASASTREAFGRGIFKSMWITLGMGILWALLSKGRFPVLPPLG